jgi:hypothetical protein
MLVRTLGRLVVAAVRQTPSPALVARIAVRPNLVSLRTLSTTLVSRDGYYEPLPPPADIRPSRQLFVANIAFNATEADIRDAAALFGEIESVRLSMSLRPISLLMLKTRSCPPRRILTRLRLRDLH